MPVVTPSRASTETVNAVPYGVSFFSVIWRRPSSSQRSSVRQRQIRPRPSFVMKLTASGVANWAAIVRSPSFSRSAASTTTTNLPWRISSIASSMVAKALRSCTCITSNRIPDQKTLDVLRQDIRLEVDAVAGLETAKRGGFERVLDEGDGESSLVQLRDGERDAFDRDRALLDEVAEELRTRVDPDASPLPLRVDRTDRPHPVHVTLDVVAAEGLTCAQGRLEVHLGAERLRAPQRLDHDVERDRVADSGDDPALDDEPAIVERRYPPTFPHDPGEHGPKATRHG